jgi:putative methionine-R-sulfoxide reductase with GAF domain
MRDYEAIARRLRPAADPAANRTAAMQAVVDALWDGLQGHGVSWVGFYIKDPAADQMILGPRRDKPACSPIGLHGVCGTAWRTREPQVVRDVQELGEHYVACDPRDRSEVVLPLFEPDGTCWGVLDVDSFDVGAFDESDVRGLRRVLEQAGFRIAPA